MSETTTEAPAATLARARDRVRELAVAIHDPGFHGLPLWDVVTPMVGNSRLNAVSLAPAGNWIATFSPAIAPALADWFDYSAKRVAYLESIGQNPMVGPQFHPALNLARIVLDA